MSGAYFLASRVKARLTKEATQNDVNLHRLVCQANMLDSLIEEINAKNRAVGKAGRTVSFESIEIAPEKVSEDDLNDGEYDDDDDLDDYCEDFDDDDDDDSSDDSGSESEKGSYNSSISSDSSSKSARSYAGEQGKSQLHRYRTDRRVSRKPVEAVRSRAGRFERQQSRNEFDGDQRSYGRVSYKPGDVSDDEVDANVEAVDGKSGERGVGENEESIGHERAGFEAGDKETKEIADSSEQSYYYYSESDDDDDDDEPSDGSYFDEDEDEEVDNYSDGSYEVGCEDGSETDASDSTSSLMRVESHSETAFSDPSVGYEVHTHEIDPSDEEDEPVSKVSSSPTLSRMEIRYMGLAYPPRSLINQNAQRLASAAC